MSKASNLSSPSSTVWAKLRFFSRIRRFIRSKAKRCQPSDDRDENHNHTTIVVKAAVAAESGDGGDDVAGAALQRAVKKIHFGDWAEKEAAAAEIGKLARDDVSVRKLMAGSLRVIPPLVDMAASDVSHRRLSAVSALIQLANGTYTNKALMVEARILWKLPKELSLVDEATKLGFSELLLSLSSLANTCVPLTPLSEIVPFLIGILESDTSSAEAKEACLGTLQNLSTVLDNAVDLVSNNVVETLLRLVTKNGEESFLEKALATLGNLVVTGAGKKAVENSPLVPGNLISALKWEEKRNKCVEWSAYILMILAHHSPAQRAKMARLGIVPVLLEAALLGSPLAQKRAMKLLQWFKDERQAKVGPHSGPQATMGPMSPSSRGGCHREGKRMMESLVKQSLHRNMDVITKRANFSSKALVISTSSKSLPY